MIYPVMLKSSCGTCWLKEMQVGTGLFFPYSGICEAGVKDAHCIHDQLEQDSELGEKPSLG